MRALAICAIFLTFVRAFRHPVGTVKRHWSLFDADSDAQSAADAQARVGEDVASILQEVMKTLAPLRSDTAANVEGISEATLQLKFDQLYSDVRKSGGLTEMEKLMIFTESDLLVEEAKTGGGIVGKASNAKLPTLQIAKQSSGVYSSERAPLVIVYGEGRVGQRVLAIGKEMGKAADIRYIEGKLLTTMQESEIKYALRGARTVVIAADAVAVEKKGWFGVVVEEGEPSVKAKGLMRLLDVAKTEGKKQAEGGQKEPIKVVVLGKACKQARSVGQLLLGDTSDLETEVILQCKQRSLSYGVVKVGRVVGDEEQIAEVKAEYREAIQVRPEDNPKPLWVSPVFVTRSRVEAAECTREADAAEALLRAAVNTHRNATFSVLSQGSAGDPSEGDWADQFMKADGPELLRVPLRFASTRQAAVKLTRIVRTLQEGTGKQGGLVTPIEVERCSNGLRILFRPNMSGYQSANEERAQRQKQEREKEERELMAKGGNAVQKTGYMSPEEEKAEEKALERKQALEKGVPAPTVSASTKKAKEGGLEVLLEETPYARVRIRRCNMGPKTVLKVESEDILLKALTMGLNQLEADYRIMLGRDFSLWETPNLSEP
ncbi:hypothetical protein B484DRAFT_443825 [Ochromonadaceae sp. CCMP2298]|nr:hypothetical protein B484DRAFT_443825 [Ochromonadaceae sp. CCMP2298]